MISCPTDSDDKDDSDWEPESLRHWSTTVSTTPRRRAGRKTTKRPSVTLEKSPLSSPIAKRSSVTLDKSPLSSPRPKRRASVGNVSDSLAKPGHDRSAQRKEDCETTEQAKVSELELVMAMEFCPGCQMPFVARTPDWCHRHVADCLDFPAKSTQECPHGPSCTFSTPSHFRQFMHRALAVKRSEVPAANGQPSGISTYSDSALQVKAAMSVDEGMNMRDAMVSAAVGVMSESERASNVRRGSGESENKLGPGKLAMFSLASATQRANTAKDVVYTPSADLGLLSLRSSSTVGQCSSECSPSSVVFDDDVEDASMLSLDESSQSDVLDKVAAPDCSVVRTVESCRLGQDTSDTVKGTCRKEMMAFPTPATGPLRQSSISNFFGGSQPKADNSKSLAGLKMKRTQSSNADQRGSGESSKGASVHSLTSARSRGRGRVGSHGINSPGTVSKGANCVADHAETGDDSTDGAVVSSAKGKRGRRECPACKRIPDTGFTVDAFSYGVIDGCKAYFLSHFHSDHYQGLNKSFSQPIYCSKPTANLVVSQLRVSVQNVHSLPMGDPVLIHSVMVTLIDANHCPGSVMFLFRLPDGRLFLHTGDCRASDELIQSPELRGLSLDALYLDTTYLKPQYTFPPQQLCVKFAVEKSKEAVACNPKTLIACGTYSIGKERVFLAVAEALGSRIAVTAAKKKILSCLEWSKLYGLLTTEWSAAQVHILPMMQLNQKGLADHLAKQGNAYSAIVGFRPTGWAQQKGQMSLGEIRPSVRGPVTVYGIPYSEHSSYSELKKFVQHFRPTRVVPTVGSLDERKQMQGTFDQWLARA